MEKMCGAKEIRTPDLFDANEALYQLSYSPRTCALAARPVSLGYKVFRPFSNHDTNVSRPYFCSGTRFKPARK